MQEEIQRSTMTADTEIKPCLSQIEPVCTFRLVNVSNLSVPTTIAIDSRLEVLYKQFIEMKKRLVSNFCCTYHNSTSTVSRPPL